MHFDQREEATAIDRYLVCGEDYKTIRNALAKGLMEGKVDGLDETCEVMSHHFLISYSQSYLRTQDSLLLCPPRGADVCHS